MEIRCIFFCIQKKKMSVLTHDMNPPTCSNSGAPLGSCRGWEQFCRYSIHNMYGFSLHSCVSFLASSPSHLDDWWDSVPVWLYISGGLDFKVGQQLKLCELDQFKILNLSAFWLCKQLFLYRPSNLQTAWRPLMARMLKLRNPHIIIFFACFFFLRYKY